MQRGYIRALASSYISQAYHLLRGALLVAVITWER